MVPRTRFPYTGAKPSIVIAIDVGTTFSGVSYTFLRPYQVSTVYNVMRLPGSFKGQEDLPTNTKVPTILYYDRGGQLLACGAEATAGQLGNPEEYIKVEWFKLLMRPKRFETSEPGMPETQLPPSHTVTDVLADFLRYMNRCAQDYIVETHPEGAGLLSSLGGEATYILTQVLFLHPNGWAGAQQSLMREAAISAGLVPDTSEGRERIQFLTEGEASLHWCMDAGLTKQESLSIGDRIIVVDAGGGTVDVSSYHVVSRFPLEIEETAEAECELAGSVFVTKRFEEAIKGRVPAPLLAFALTRTIIEIFEGSELADAEYTDRVTEEFDRKTKCIFDDAGKRYFLKVGPKKLKDPNVNVDRGTLKLSGRTIASAFKPSCDRTVDAISKHLQSKATATVFLVGGFAASPWLQSRIARQLEPKHPEATVKHTESDTAKAAAHGAVAWYMDRLVTARVAGHTFGAACSTLFDRTNREHRLRLRNTFVSEYDGLMHIGGLFQSIVKKGESVPDGSTYHSSFMVPSKFKVDVTYELELERYGGTLKNIEFYDQDQGSFNVASRTSVEIPSNALQPVMGPKGLYWGATVDVIVNLGETELKYHVEWDEEGATKRYGRQYFVYSQDTV
ncbi:hypothetical protein FRB99_001522 [Tulasnella sp. 403]|nr:hypothetical protein FRB99_001522 [Tulasnella sp. 403]